MIAKSMFLLLLFGNSFLLYSQSESHHKNKYARVLEEYDIHPPRMEYGFPFWYGSDFRSPYLVVFLKEGIQDVVSYGKSIRVTSPTKKTAMMIRYGESYADYIYDSYEFLNIYLVVDSLVSYDSLMTFIRYLPEECTTLHLIG